jgi:hypothetical protein
MRLDRPEFLDQEKDCLKFFSEQSGFGRLLL